MERDLFDNLTRAVASGVSRRSAIRALIGGGAAAVAGIGSASAKGKPDHDRPKSGKPDCCPAERPRICDFTCTDPMSDPNNCGGCGTVCVSGVCSNGTCHPVAPGPTCSDGEKNQGESDIDCGGINCPECADGKTCNSGADCQSHNCVNGICKPAPTCTDADNGTPCDTGNMGVCAAGTIRCDSGTPVCVQTNSPSAEICNGLDDDCDGEVDEGVICPDPQNASGYCDGAKGCAYRCNSGFGDCDGNADNGCETPTSNDINNCGGCGVVCPTDPNGSNACVNGACTLTCNDGYTLVGDQCVADRPTLASLSVPDMSVSQSVNATITLTAAAGQDTQILLARLPAGGDPDADFVFPDSVVISTGSSMGTFGVTGISTGPGILEASLDGIHISDSFTVFN